MYILNKNGIIFSNQPEYLTTKTWYYLEYKTLLQFSDNTRHCDNHPAELKGFLKVVIKNIEES